MKNTPKCLSFLYFRPESNWYELSVHSILSATCLPVPPRKHCYFQYFKDLHKHKK